MPDIRSAAAESRSELANGLVYHEFGELNGMVMSLRPRLQKLEEKIRPVLMENEAMPSPGVGNYPPEEYINVPLAREMRNVAHELHDALKLLDEILERVNL